MARINIEMFCFKIKTFSLALTQYNVLFNILLGDFFYKTT
jgi:hypothetical protein